MTVRFLPQIQPRKRDAKSRHPAKNVGEASGSDRFITFRHQRSKTELERLRELFGRKVRRDTRELRRRLGKRLFGEIAGGLQTVAHLREQRPIWFMRGADPRAKLLARV